MKNHRLALSALLLGLHFAGFWALRKGQRALGHGLILAGCVYFGGGIGLMAQVFQISSEIGGGVLLWAIGALAVALERHDLDLALRENGRDGRAEIRVDRSGRAALVALHAGDHTWPAW